MKKEEVVITGQGKPAGVLIRRVEAARRSLKAGRGIRIEDLEK